MRLSPREVSIVACVVPQPQRPETIAARKRARRMATAPMLSALAVPAARAVLAVETLAVAGELLLQLLAALLGHRHAPRLVLVEGQRRVHARDVVAPERIGQLLRAEPVHAQFLQRRTPCLERRL